MDLAILASPPPTSTPRYSAGWRGAWEVALIFGIFFVSAADTVPGVNESHYLTRLKHSIDPTYCAGDLFLESQDAHITFIVALAWLTSFLSLETIAWAGRLVTWLGLACAWWRLSWAVCPRPLMSVLGAAIVVTGINEGNFAGEWMIGGFESKPIAYIFVLLALRAVVVGKWNMVWIHLGIATAWHALVGGWSVLILLWLWFCVGRREAPLERMLPFVILGGLIGVVGVVPALWLSMGQASDVATEAAKIYVYDRLPHHLSPFHKPAEWLAERLGRHAGIVALMVGLLVARYVDLGRQWASLAADGAGRVALFACGAMALAIAGMLIEISLWNEPDIAAGLLRYYWFRMADVAVPIAAAVLAAALLAPRLDSGSRLGIVLASVLTIVTGLHLAGLVHQRWESPIPPADRKMENFADWVDVCRWSRDEVPPGALVLTPRLNQTFKWRTERAEVVTYKDVPQDAESLLEWRERMDAFYPSRNEPAVERGPELSRLGTPRMLELAEKYGIDYIVTTHADPVSLSQVYSNATYVVYQVD